MGSNLRRRSVASVVCALLAVCGMLAVFSYATWAGRGQDTWNEGRAATAFEREAALKIQKLTGTARPRGRSPIESVQEAWEVTPEKRGRSIATSRGWVEPGVDVARLRQQAPLVAGASGRSLEAHGKKGELAAGLNAIQIREESLRTRTIDSIVEELGRSGIQVLDVMHTRALLVNVPKDRVEALARADFLESGLVYEALYKLPRDFARTPFAEKKRALADTLDIRIHVVPGTDLVQAKRDLEAAAGVMVAQDALYPRTFTGSVHFSRVPRILHLPTVLDMSEMLEFQLHNTDTPTTAMVGNVKENLPFQKPYHDVGVDGGGIDRDAGGVSDGRRLNNGTDVVPPQIVAVTDNGISYDSSQFSQSLTVSSSTLFPIGGGHRKVHSIQPVTDSGSTCDAPLSGSGTHGNVVAGAIAGDASSLGVTLTKHFTNVRPAYSGVAMDGVARGARIIMQDAAGVDRCTLNELMERGGNVVPGSLLTLLTQAICPRTPASSGVCLGLIGGAGEVHLQVFPFGVPNFDNDLDNTTDGTYTQEAQDIDRFLVNNRDFMVFVPVGNQGTNNIPAFRSGAQELGNKYPALFDGTGADNDPNSAVNPLQVSPPATAKNLVSVGSHFQDFQTLGSGNAEENINNFSSKGPATAVSLRMAPMIVGVGADITGFFNGPNANSVAVWRSRDNDNDTPIDSILDDTNFGTSYAAGEIAGVAALIRDYFAQGFYPTGTRIDGDRIPNVSGPLVKAAIAASANFEEVGLTDYQFPGDKQVGQARAADLGTVSGAEVGIIGNNEQGYGRPVVTSVLPLANWPTSKGIGAPNTLEYPSAGLLVWDEIATGEPAINNTRLENVHTFRVEGANAFSFCTGGSAQGQACATNADCPGTGAVCSRKLRQGQLRIAVAWSDPPPDVLPADGLLINDLDLEVESPGPDGDINTGADNDIYDGNLYEPGSARLGQWSKRRATGSIDQGDRRNPVEAVHLSADPDSDGNSDDSRLFTGTWRVLVKRGPTQITVLTGPDEDTILRNGRLDPGVCSNDATRSCVNRFDCTGNATCNGTEDTDADGFLDADGQPYGLVVAGPVFGLEAQSFGSPATVHTFPAGVARLDKSLYGCADQVRLNVFALGTNAAAVGGAVTFEVVNKGGTVVDTERAFAFTPAASPNSYVSPALAVRETKPAAISFNGILETSGVTTDEPYFVRATYATSPRNAVASGRISCAPNLFVQKFVLESEDSRQDLFSGGCDNDQFPDAGETLTYSIAFVNANRDHDYTGVQATLTVGGAGAAAVRVLNSPVDIGRLPGGQTTAVTFALSIVDAAAMNSIAVNNRFVDLTVTLRGNSGNIQLPRQTFTFRRALNSDSEVFHYSTDFPAGGREIRDFNRSLTIDKPDIADPFLGIPLPDEDVAFSSMFVPGDSAGRITNLLGEDLNANGSRDAATEFDLIPDGAFNTQGILLSSNPADTHRVPFNFENNDGGFIPFRLPLSRPGSATRNVWEWNNNGPCGFQTAVFDPDTAAGFQNHKAGIWHTGDGDPNTPSNTSVCENHPLASDGNTPPNVEYFEDFVISPIIAKVHQTNDSRGFAFSAEFQRFGLNANNQERANQDGFGYSGANFNADNNLADDTGNCLLCQEFDFGYGGMDYQVGHTFAPNYPNTVNGTLPRTFGPTVDPDGSTTRGPGAAAVTGDEIGFTGFAQNTSSPIPQAPPDQLAYPLDDAPTIFSPFNKTLPCPTTTNANGECAWTNNIQGPVRSYDFTLVNYEAGFPNLVGGRGGDEIGNVSPYDINQGPRWAIAVGFFNLEAKEDLADYGFGFDDLVFEWDEKHPLDEGAFVPAHTPACQRFAPPGQGLPSGAQCATLSVDRVSLVECDDALTVTVNDQKRRFAGTVQVLGASNSDSRPVSNGVTTALHPIKRFTLQETPAGSGLFVTRVTTTQTVNTANQLFVSPSGDNSIQFYYQDPQCDGNGNGLVGQNDFDNIDGDNLAPPPPIGTGTDNCPFAYNPGQRDIDGDGVGDGGLPGEVGCDNCPVNANNSNGDPQTDSDADGVGDACDFDDVDFDGVVNDLDNCPDVYNVLQTVGVGGKGTACDLTNNDRDGDGVVDRSDNCVRVYNNLQENADRDRVGDACDGDCTGARKDFLTTGTCSRSSTQICGAGLPACPMSSTCVEDPKKVCTASSPNCTCGTLTPETCETAVVRNSGGCGPLNDDIDSDGVQDAVDNCPVIYNQPSIPGTLRQADKDNDGLGDICDSDSMIDGDNSGIPDDVVSFGMIVNCNKVPLPTLVVEGTAVRDINPPPDGDGDAFCDTGETCEMTVTVFNNGPMSLTGASFHLATADPDIDCVTIPSVQIGDLPVGTKVDTACVGGTIDSSGVCQGGVRRPFRFRVSANTQSLPAPPPADQTKIGDPAKGDFSLNVTSREALGTKTATDIQIVLDANAPPADQIVRDWPPLGLSNGRLFETFDIDKDGVGGVNLSDGRGGIANDTFGYTIGSAQGGLNVLTGIGCGGYQVPPVDRGCRIDPDNEMTWHIHCPVTTCPAPQAAGTNAPLTVTPADGAMSWSGRNSLHWGRHTNVASRLGDTSSFREVGAYATNPINLTPIPLAGDLVLSFYHIADMMDSSCGGRPQCAGIPVGTASDYGDVQIRVDRNADPLVDEWGFWDKLAPFVNVYDHIPYVWSYYGTGTTYCDLTPADTGTAPPNPRGVHETMCWPLGVWSHCGNAWGIDTAYGCSDGKRATQNGGLEPAGGALWVQSKFSLANFLGSRIQIRWIAQGWEFDLNFAGQDYATYGGEWANNLHEDGWWIDDILVTGAIRDQVALQTDTRTAPPTTCPALASDNCNENAAGTDRGFNVVVDLKDSNNNGMAERGETVQVEAIRTSNPGLCLRGVTEYQFRKNGVIVKDFSANAFYKDAPDFDTTYQVMARCSSDLACTTVTGASATILSYRGDGYDIALNLAHNRSTGVTTIAFQARAQAPTIPQVSGYSMYSGTINSAGDPLLSTLSGMTCMGSSIPAAALDTTLFKTDGVQPVLGKATYYLAGHNPTSSGTPGVLLGRRGDGTLNFNNGPLRPVATACP